LGWPNPGVTGNLDMLKQKPKVLPVLIVVAVKLIVVVVVVVVVVVAMLT